MAEKRSEKRYGKSPKIEEKAKLPDKGEPVVKATPEKSSPGKPHAKEASGTDHVPVPEETTEQPKGDEAHSVDGSGNPGAMPMHARHAMDRHEMLHRHMSEHQAMHSRHEREHMSHDMGGE